MKRSKIALLSAVFAPFAVQAATGYRTAILDEIQSSAATSAAGPALVYLAQSTTWLGGVSCPTEWAYFDSKLNPHFLATVLTAAATQRVLRVYVDDSLPKVNGYCQVSNVSLLSIS